jgi:hypothetical protein
MKIFIFLIIIVITNCDVGILSPAMTINSRIKYNETAIFQVNSNSLKPNHFYKIMVHYLGSVFKFLIKLGFEFDIQLICDDIETIITANSEFMGLKDFSEYDFKTDDNSLPR